jgi:hypothetical protein
MRNAAETIPLFEWSGAATVTAQASMLRAAIETIPEIDRPAVFALLQDLLAAKESEKAAPLRGGPVLNNVFQLFKKTPGAVMAAAEVQEALSERGNAANAQAVRNALNYLNGRSVLRRVGYGRYQLADGRIVEGPP